jgi:hypothetical protein
VTTPSAPTRNKPDEKWKHHRVWDRVNTMFYSLPNYFETELVIKGINVTEVFSVGGAFSSVVETQVVAILELTPTLRESSFPSSIRFKVRKPPLSISRLSWEYWTA